jgi:serine/threonine protein kinase
MLTSSSTDFLELVHKSGLVEERTVQGIFVNQAPPSPTQAAEQLVKRGVLTSFQAKMLLAGRHRGLVLGPYKILDQIGRGGMGIVYLAEHKKLQRQVAIKVLPKDKTTDQLTLERFYREARAVAALDHPNIVQAYDVGECMGIHYFAMEYVRGTNLQDHLLRKGPLPWKVAVGYMAQVCWGLQHAHTRGLVHRDIKPGNLLVDRSGTVKILDLGLARCFTKAQDNLTANLSDGCEITGSIDYIAPEQAVGGAQDIRTDIYSLGATFFALMAGKPPFSGSAAQKLLQHQMKDPPLLDEVRPEVPEEVSAVIVKMMQKRPEQRYPTPADVVADLAPWLPTTVAQRLTDGLHTRPPVPLPQTTTPPADEEEDISHQETVTALQGRTKVNLGADEESGVSPKRRRKRQSKKREAEKRRRLMLVVTGVMAVLLPLCALGGWAIVRHAAKPDQPGPKSDVPVAAAPARSEPRSSPAATASANPVYSPSKVEEEPIVGRVAPEIEGEDLTGECFLLSDYRGKVVVLKFWGFW